MTPRDWGVFVLHQGDCLETMRGMPDGCADSIVTDPPYGLSFMGKHWDHGVPRAETWREALRVLKPGGHLLSFFGSRTYHRGVVEIEDAGFEVRDQIMWVFGSGFPKSHNGEWGGTALKPAHEPICVARKPLIGTVAANVLAHGTGGLNIDGCRVPTSDDLNGGAYSDTDRRNEFFRGLDPGVSTFIQPAGRWPANLIHDGSDEVLAAFPETGKSTGGGRSNGDKFGGGYAPSGKDDVGYGDTGSAARFFYCAKASRSDRNSGLAGQPTKDLNWSSGTQSPGTFQSEGTNRAVQNHHPTVKPTDLMRYLCRLVTPPGGVVLDPFTGSGSTGKAAVLEGFRFIGCELSAEYVDIAERRIAHALFGGAAFGAAA